MFRSLQFSRVRLQVHSFVNDAIVLEDRILVTYPQGNYEILDANYRRLDAERLSSVMFAGVLEAMSRFYR